MRRPWTAVAALAGRGLREPADVVLARHGDRRFQALFEHAPLGVALCSLDGAFVDVNPAVAELLAGTGVDPVGGGLIQLAACSDPAPEGWAETLETVRRGQREVARLDLPVPVRRDDVTSVRWIGLTAVKIALGRDPFLLVHLDDITPRRQEEQRLARLALRDPLTGLANRTLITVTLDEALARSARTGLGVGVLFIDLDGFKRVNDTLGHETGDALLVEVAQRLTATLRAGDVAGRLGGDEFLVVAEGVAGDPALEDLVRRVDAAVRRPLVVGSGADARQVPVAASVGAVLSRPGDTGSSVVRRADAAMFAAKRARRRAVQRFVARPGATVLGAAPDRVQLSLLHEQAVVAQA